MRTVYAIGVGVLLLAAALLAEALTDRAVAVVAVFVVGIVLLILRYEVLGRPH